MTWGTSCDWYFGGLELRTSLGSLEKAQGHVGDVSRDAHCQAGKVSVRGKVAGIILRSASPCSE